MTIITASQSTRAVDEFVPSPILGIRHIRLRPEIAGDLEFIHSVRTSEASGHRWDARGAGETLGAFQATSRSAGDFVRFVVEAAGTGTPIGVVRAYDVNLRNGTGWIGTYLDADHLSTGLGAEASMCLCNYLFSCWNLRKVYADVTEFNTPVKGRFWRESVRHEGTLSEHVYANGAYVDREIYSFSREDWVALRQRLGLGAHMEPSAWHRSISPTAVSDGRLGMHLRLGTTRLRAVDPSDHPRLFAMAIEREFVFRSVFRGYVPRLEDFTRQALGSIAQFSVVDTDTDGLIGHVHVHELDLRSGFCDVVILLDHENERLHASAAFQLFSRYAFGVWDLRKVSTTLLDFQVPAYEASLAFSVVEAHRPAHEYYDGRWWDTLTVTARRDRFEEWLARSANTDSTTASDLP